MDNDYYCSCPKGFSGRNCENQEACALRPCENQGICHEVAGGYRCDCPNGFIGERCEVSNLQNSSHSQLPTSWNLGMGRFSVLAVNRILILIAKAIQIRFHGFITN
ncbi:unnamed protein product [Protopolystoma xenopodis]|uniref:EGF-like domain-containing protein n=1 Tax=Protopolystoma xenopodis TaxID=117903 RepID=A0A3S5B0Y5_9PLAT|nr:unnamed protein product [Protopolystoma xenopodis]